MPPGWLLLAGKSPTTVLSFTELQAGTKALGRFSGEKRYASTLSCFRDEMR
jgi:hypothetical protein